MKIPLTNMLRDCQIMRRDVFLVFLNEKFHKICTISMSFFNCQHISFCRTYVTIYGCVIYIIALLFLGTPIGKEGKSSDTLQIANSLEKENQSMGKKLKAIKNHIQVVTCFDGQMRKVTQI